MKAFLFWLLLFGLIILRAITAEKIYTKALYDFDEARYAEVAKNITKSRQFFIPLSGGPDDPTANPFILPDGSILKPYLWKPPLHPIIIWLNYQIFGVNEFAVRFPSLLFGLLSLPLIFLLSRAIFPNSRLDPYLSVILLSSSSDFSYLSSQGIAETTLLFFELLTIFLLLKQKKLPSLIAFTLAIFTKSFAVFWLFPLTLIILLSQRSRLQTIIQYYFSIFLLSCPWHLFMFLKYGQDFWQIYFLNNTIGRGTGLQNNIAPVYWYLKYFLWQWPVYLLLILPLLFSSKKLHWLPTVWATLILIPLSIAKSKVWWYVFPFWIPVLIQLSALIGPVLSRSRLALAYFIVCLFLINIYSLKQSQTRPDYNLGIKKVSQSLSQPPNQLSVFGIPYESPLFYLNTGLIDRQITESTKYLITNIDYFPQIDSSQWQVVGQQEKTYLLERQNP
jgi:4-amino-4-deoxy-L-arabinose transferase-like glycosyltransferase